tara:strand:- start:16492 stop:17193 length:702 start_codon:yes stop_codon:yes gene_type:complete
MSRPQAKDRRILYGRRRGKPLRKGQQRLIENDLPRLQITTEEEEINLPSLFGSEARAYWLEIGFGGGEHLAWQANANPDIGIIGCEPFVNGVAMLLAKLEENGAQNVRLHTDAAERLIERLPAESIDRAFILFPDPWPKSSHHKRRFVSGENINALARIMTSGGELRIATDHTDYGAWILWHMLRSDHFIWQAESPDDWRSRPADWPPTRYEMKAVGKGLRPVYYRFLRKNRV